MNRIFKLTLISLLASCSHSEHSENSEHSDGHEDHDLIELSAEQAERFGVKTDSIAPGPFATVVRASGVIERAADAAVSAVAPVAGTVKLNVSPGAHVAKGQAIGSVNTTAVAGGDQNRAARAAVEAAQKEADRLAVLFRERLVTAAEYNAAIAALEQAKAAASSGSTTIVSPIDGVVTAIDVADGAYAAAGQAVASVGSDSRLTLHAEVPAELYAQMAAVTDARIGEFTLSEHGGRKIGVSAENGYACVFFAFNSDGLVTPGSGGEVYLLGPERGGVVAVPLAAVVEQQGEYFIYSQHSPGHYEKHAVTLGPTDGRRVEILSGFPDGEPVVTSGAITVRLAEASGAIPEGHSHQH